MSVSVEVAVSRVTGCTTVALRGDLDLATAGRVRARLSAVVAEHPLLVVVDVGDLDFVDATGLAPVVEAARALRDSGGRLVLAHPSRVLRRVIALLDLEALLPVEG